MAAQHTSRAEGPRWAGELEQPATVGQVDDRIAGRAWAAGLESGRVVYFDNSMNPAQRETSRRSVRPATTWRPDGRHAAAPAGTRPNRVPLP